jgi:hypothetical protein
MTPKEKAVELYEGFINYSQQCINDEIITQFNLENPAYKGSKFVALMGFSKKYNAKKCALIAVDYLIKEQTMWQNGEVNPILYWQEVKQEIEKL